MSCSRRRDSYADAAPEGAPAMDEAAEMVHTYFTSLPTEQFSNLKG